MQNKLPEVGKRYRTIEESFTIEFEIEVLSIFYEKSGNPIVSWRLLIGAESEVESALLDYFWGSFEELPEDKAETKPDEKTMKRKNRILCKICLDIIESKHCHDYVTCSCGAVSADGGNDYFKRGGKPEDMIDLAFPERLIDITIAAKESHIPELSPEVKEAMKKLKHAKSSLKAFLMRMEDNEKALAYIRAYEREVDLKTDQLLNALDKQFKVSETTATKENLNNTKEDEVQVNDVEKAKEELRNALSWGTLEQRAKWVNDKAQALLDALDAEKENNEVKAELPKEEPKSIWKPVRYYLSQPYAFQGFLDFGSDKLFGKLADGLFYFNGEKFPLFKESDAMFATIADFINEHNEMKERITKPENK